MKFDGESTVPADPVLFMLISVPVVVGLLQTPRERKDY